MTIRRLHFQSLESRDQPSRTVVLAGGVLTVTGTDGADRLEIYRDADQIIVRDRGQDVGRFALAAVGSLVVDAAAGDDIVKVSSALTLPTQIRGGDGRDRLAAGSGTTTLNGGAGDDLLKGGTGIDSFDGGAGMNILNKRRPDDAVTPQAGDRIIAEADIPAPADVVGGPQQTLRASEVEQLLNRASAVSASRDAIIVIVDRNGRILGVRVEDGVSPAITGNTDKLVFAIDGALALARTGAFFGNNQAPLTSRTVQFISQSTITQREVESDPSIFDRDSTDRGPGYVAAVGVKGHFPPGISETPQVDLFGIEHTNRDTSYSPGADGLLGNADDILRAGRFDIDGNWLLDGTAQALYAPDSYGLISGRKTTAQPRGIGTLPGGIPIVKNGEVVGGIGVFFPGTTGYATEENSKLSSTYDPTKPDRTAEAEYIAFAALGGSTGAGFRIGSLAGCAPLEGFDLPFGRIDLVGITLDIFGPGGESGIDELRKTGRSVGSGVKNGIDEQVTTNRAVTTIDGLRAPDSWLVQPHDGVGITAADVSKIINDGIAQANLTRAAIRLPSGVRTRMVFAVADKTGTIVGLYRMADATIFSIDVAVAKARNVAYYADAVQLQAQDKLAGIDAGTAFTNRTFRYLAEPRFPEGIDGASPGPFSQLIDGGADPRTGLQVGARLPASAYQSVFGYDSFNAGTNFHDPNNRAKQNGIVFFPGSAPLYKNGQLAGGFGVSGDGVDQDDVVTGGGQAGYEVPTSVKRADDVTFRGVRLPYQKSNRNPEG